MKEIKQYPLGRNPSPFDARDYNLRHFIPFKTEQEAITEKKWEFSGESLNQENTGHCFPSGTLIRMGDGSSKKIEDINNGDIIISAEGNKQKVTKKMRRLYTGKLVNLKLWGHNFLKCTPEHPILTKKGYIKAVDLNEDDFVAIPVPEITYNEYISFSSVLNNIEIPSCSNRLREDIEKNYKLGRLFGLYLAEGYSDKESVRLAFNINERYTLVEEVLESLKKELGIEATLKIREKNNTIIVKFFGKYIANFFDSLFGKGAENKYLSSCLSGPKDFRKGILDGWMAGDGYFRRSGFDGVTTSKQLAHDMFVLANELGYAPSLRSSTPSMNKYAKTRKLRWDLEIGIGRNNDNRSRNWRIIEEKNYIWRKVRKIEFSENFSGEVYNLEVENDHSYIAEGIGVHNCVGFSGASWGINLPVNTLFTNEDGHRMYYECKIIEGEPEQENGAYVRSIAKVLKNNGRLEAYAFAPDMATIRWWLLNKGPVIAGTIWTQSMFTPDENNIITIDQNVVGGHAFVINEVREDGYFGIQNSWGKDWGDNGKAYIHYLDFEKIFKYGGEAMAAVELAGETPVEQPKKCWLWELIKQIFKI